MNNITNISELKEEFNKEFLSPEERENEILELTKKLEPFLEKEGSQIIASMLSLGEEEFALMAPIVLEEVQKSLNNPNDQLLICQTLNARGIKSEDIKEMYNNIFKVLDNCKEILSPAKIYFMKELLNTTYNLYNSNLNIAKRVISIPIELTHENAKIPTYGSDGAAALDLYSPEEHIIMPGETKIISLEIKTSLPPGYAFLVHPRSGLSSKTKMRLANSIGLIDSDYRGKIGVIVENIQPDIEGIEYITSDEGIKITSIKHGSPIVIGKGERFAQMRLVEVPRAAFVLCDKVDLTERGEGGFGSTGTN